MREAFRHCGSPESVIDFCLVGGENAACRERGAAVAVWNGNVRHHHNQGAVGVTLSRCGHSDWNCGNHVVANPCRRVNGDGYLHIGFLRDGEGIRQFRVLAVRIGGNGVCSRWKRVCLEKQGDLVGVDECNFIGCVCVSARILQRDGHVWREIHTCHNNGGIRVVAALTQHLCNA